MDVGGDLTPGELLRAEQLYGDLRLRRGAMELALFQLLEFSLIRTIPVAQPLAGAEFSVVVPGGVFWELLHVQALFNASAVVATRIPSLRFDDPDGRQDYRYLGNSSLAASQGAFFVWDPGVGVTVAGSANVQSLPTPPIVLAANWTVRSITSNIDAGDQYSIITLVVREWSPPRVARYLKYLTDDLDSSGGLL